MLKSQLEPKTNTNLSTDLYETDFYAWTQEQSILLSRGQWQSLDMDNLVEELEWIKCRVIYQFPISLMK
jgi:hypothetical protein